MLRTDAAMLQHAQQTQPTAFLAHPSPSPSLAASIRSLRSPPARAPPTARTPTAAAAASHDDDERRRRKPPPSPLQHTAGSPRSPTTPTPANAPANAPYRDEPRSPREHLDALLLLDHTTAAATPSALPTLIDRPPRALGHANSAVSPAMPPPSRPFRPETKPRPSPRNPSIDSAASSATSTASAAPRPPPGHSSRPSQDVSTANPPDMAALIAAAGSPEAALLAMWKEKQSQASHNQQLWRLVEKQRAMVIGLQKDLERALRDKDRYRKKMKESADQALPAPGALQRADTFDSLVAREHSQSPAPSDRHDELPASHDEPPARHDEPPARHDEPPARHDEPPARHDEPPARHDEPAPVEHSAALQTQAQFATQLYPESQLATSPAHSSVASPTASSINSAINSPTDYSVKPLALGSKALGLDAVMHENTLGSQRTQHTPRPATPPQPDRATSSASTAQPQLAVTQATPELRSDGFSSPPRKPAQPLRKAPPAPLNLSKPVTTSAHLHQATNQDDHDDDDDDYDDTLEVDEIPIVADRGRRKTREDDDRAREAVTIKDEEARSKSAKKKSESKGKSRSTPVEASGENPVPQMVVASPQSPRQFNPLQAGLPLSPRHPPPGSLNAMLSPATSESSIMANRSVGSFASPLLSPGLPTSPRPGDRPPGSPLPRFPKQSITSPPMSPTDIPPPAPSTLQQSGPPPPHTPQSYQSPPGAQAERPAQSKRSPDLLTVPNAQPSPDSTSSSPTLNEIPDAEHVYRGLVSEQYPGLLLPPNALPSIEAKVFSSRLRPSRLSILAPRPQEEDPVFILAIYARSNNKQLWRLEKNIASLPALDAQLRSLSDFQARLPDRILFSGHAPAKIDARRIALNQYFDIMLETPMSEEAALMVCDFFSTDVIGAQTGDRLTPEPTLAPAVSVPRTKGNKEGYLTKRGKNFGGWKARYFVLQGPEFRYYEVEGGAHMGTIKLLNAQIGKQSQQQSNQSPQRREDGEDNQYRHAFLILEPKRKDSASLVRHVLCAENDEERDAWVDALLQHVDYHDETSPVEAKPAVPQRLQKPPPKAPDRSLSRDSPDVDQQNDRLQSLSYDDTVAAEAPVRGPNHRDAMGGKPSRGSPKNSSFSQDSMGHFPAISAPSNATPIQNAENWGNKAVAGPTAARDKKRSIFGFRGRGGSSDLAPIQVSSTPSQAVSGSRGLPPNRNIFGMTLQEAVEFSRPLGLGPQLPTVVFRCLEYLQEKKAIKEEGIFRLSGSNIVIKGLRDRFNHEGDIPLVEGPYTDVHAVASLLKLYLRELPASILTRELHLDFLKVLDMDERSKKIQTFNVLVHKLPVANFELLRHLSSFLIEVVDNAATNKMTVRNVGIVFAPTLNIPAPLIAFFLTDHVDIFGSPLDEASSPIHEIRANATSLGDDAIRSPRRQMFSDLPTPAYNETSFPQRFDKRPSQFQDSSAPSYPAPPPSQQQQQQQQQQQHRYPQQHHQQQERGRNGGYDSGFIPMQPSYDASQYEQAYLGGEGYGSLNSAVQGNSREQRQRRRESGMLLMNMNGSVGGQRKGSNGSSGSSNQRVREEPRANPLTVREGMAFD
ncbi:GTPase activator [Ascochyta rabiei]|uniref:GTPase activator n=1 Tax=Didymella rabiei TaxID=5454 RepID=A0A163B9X8_DIDRA|nr:GTPase activator [Ascochyta rabiei]